MIKTIVIRKKVTGKKVIRKVALRKIALRNWLSIGMAGKRPTIPILILAWGWWTAASAKGNIWFLGGTGGDAPAERTCLQRIPAGKQFFFPLVNLVVWDEPLNTAERRQLLDDIFSDQVPGVLAAEACRLSATVDGTPVIFDGIPIERVQSPLFTYLGDNEALADGFWVLSPKLKRGEHTLSFSGGLCQFGSNISVFEVDVTYSFTVR